MAEWEKELELENEDDEENEFCNRECYEISHPSM
jgi:hypothetical protein